MTFVEATVQALQVVVWLLLAFAWFLGLWGASTWLERRLGGTGTAVAVALWLGSIVMGLALLIWSGANR